MLSFQKRYVCRHAGACCSAGWVEPLEDGRCRHFDADPSGGCTLQRASGHGALPHACQQFPRVATLSPLGVSVTLSAFCPTAASLLLDDGPFAIETLEDTRTYEGLDARAVLPPLLRPGMLMDWDAVARWEELAVATLSNHRDDVDRALAIIEDGSMDVCEAWTPGDGRLSDALERGFADAGISAAPAGRVEPRTDRGSLRKRGQVLEFKTCPRLAPETPAPANARFLASHAFACWPMYDGRGIRGALEWLVKARTALDDERRSHSLAEAFRQTDLRLRHAERRS